LAVERRAGSVIHTRDAPASEIQHGERLQDIVQLSRGKRDGDILISLNAPDVFEVTYSVLVEHHSLDWKTGLGLSRNKSGDN